MKKLLKVSLVTLMISGSLLNAKGIALSAGSGKFDSDNGKYMKIEWLMAESNLKNKFYWALNMNLEKLTLDDSSLNKDITGYGMDLHVGYNIPKTNATLYGLVGFSVQSFGGTDSVGSGTGAGIIYRITNSLFTSYEVKSSSMELETGTKYDYKTSGLKVGYKF